MKILVVCQYYYPEPFRITDICESLVKRGHEVTILTGLPNYPEGKIPQEYRHGNKREEKLNGVNVIRCYEIGRGKSKIKLFLNYLSYSVSATLKAFFMKEVFDVVMVNQLSPVMMGIPALAYRRRFKTKVLLYCLDLWPDSLVAGGIKKDSIMYNIFLEISIWIYTSADLILVSSNMFKQYFEDVLRINREKINHLPQYAEDLFAEEMELANKDNKYNFVFAGNVGDVQSVDTIIKAANELRNHKEILFHIVGDGSRLNDCKSLSAKLGLSNINYYGRRPISDMPYFYSMADAMLVTLKKNNTISYTLPGKVQSYMAAGKPIIGAIDGETRYIIDDAKCGFCCTAEDYKTLAELILEFITENKGKQFSINSKEYYKNKFDKEKFMYTLESKLNSLAEFIT